MSKSLPESAWLSKGPLSTRVYCCPRLSWAHRQNLDLCCIVATAAAPTFGVCPQVFRQIPSVVSWFFLQNLNFKFIKFSSILYYLKSKFSRENCPQVFRQIPFVVSWFFSKFQFQIFKFRTILHYIYVIDLNCLGGKICLKMKSLNWGKWKFGGINTQVDSKL